MVKQLSLILVLALAGLANAAPVAFNDSLTGYTDGGTGTGSSEDLQTVEQLAANGLKPQVIWGNGDGVPDDTGSGSWERIMFDSAGALFGSGEPGDNGRNTLLTIDPTYNTVSFEAFVTIHNVTSIQNIFMGIGSAVRGMYGVPDWNQLTDAVWTELTTENTRVFHQDSTGYTTTVNPAITEGGTHRVSLAYDANAQTVIVSADLDYNGTFVADFTCEATSTAGLWADGHEAHVYIGADDNTLLTDFDVIVAGVQNPSPANGATLVDRENVVLSWYGSDTIEPVGYKLFMRAGDPNFVDTAANLIDGVSIAPTPDPITYAVGNLDFDTDYYWYVDTIALDDANSIDGYVWKFTTSPAEPIILTNPVSHTVTTGGSAVLTVTAKNATSYQWYHNDVAIDGETDSTITVSDYNQDKEGEYYCMASNATLVDATSRIAYLWSERLMAHWTFDDTVTDVIDSWTGIFMDTDIENTELTPVYATESISGMSLDLQSATSYLTIDGSEQWFNFFTNGFTVSMWVNSTLVADSYGAVLSKRGDNKGFWASYQYDNANVAVMNGTLTQTGGDIVTPGQWHQFVSQYDLASETLSIYSDGRLISSVSVAPALLAGSTVPLIIGAELTDGSTNYNGLVDDIMIWSYALDKYEIAHMYTDVMTDKTVCIERTGLDFDVSGPDGTPDCRVNVYDFAELAADWLNCNKVAGSTSGEPGCL